MEGKGQKLILIQSPDNSESDNCNGILGQGSMLLLDPSLAGIGLMLTRRRLVNKDLWLGRFAPLLGLYFLRDGVFDSSKNFHFLSA